MKRICFLVNIVVIALFTSCYDDVDFDKVSDEIAAQPALLLPLANADVTVEYLFDEQENCVKYVTDEEGDQRIVISSDHDSIATLPLYQLININTNDMKIEKLLDISSYTSSDMTSTDEDSISLPILLALPLTNDYMSITSAKADYTISLKCNSFSIPANITVDIGGNKTYLDVKKSSTGIQTNTTDGILRVYDNEIPIKITVKVSAKDVGSLGTIDFLLSLSELKSITGEMEDLHFTTNHYIHMTGMKQFNRIGKEVDFRNPQVLLSYSNSSDINFNVVPNITAIKKSNYKDALHTSPFDISDNETDGSLLFDNNNSNVGLFFKQVPDSLSYHCDITGSMPSDKKSVTICSDDILYLGYSYEIPVEFIVKNDDPINTDTVDISDIPNLDDLDFAKLIVYTKNSLPFSLSIKLITFDSKTGNKYSSLHIADACRSPKLDSNGKSTNDIETKSSLELTRQQMDDLHRTDRLIVQVSLETPEERYVVLKTDDIFKMNISLAAGFEINTNKIQ